jgi:hypothetical protein
MYNDLVELARICFRQACGTKNEAAAAVLRRMAKEFQDRAAKLDRGKVPGLREVSAHFCWRGIPTTEDVIP